MRHLDCSHLEYLLGKCVTDIELADNVHLKRMLVGNGLDFDSQRTIKLRSNVDFCDDLAVWLTIGKYNFVQNCEKYWLDIITKDALDSENISKAFWQLYCKCPLLSPKQVLDDWFESIFAPVEGRHYTGHYICLPKKYKNQQPQ